MLGACDVVNGTAVQMAVGVGFLVQLKGISGTQQQIDHPPVFCFGAIAIHDTIGLGEPRRFLNPAFQRSCQLLSLPTPHPAAFPGCGAWAPCDTLSARSKVPRNARPRSEWSR